MSYRADIDGLRAVAVIAVILFHLGVWPVTGGFVGVDVFFVISGYLITGLILGDVEAGRFSLLAFYERRARRILPALFLVLAFCTAVVAIIGGIGNTADFGESLIATVFFVSNIHFWLESGYFDPDAHVKPLLHTWSLAVEEQFYLTFPLFMIAVAHWLRRRWILATLPFLAGFFVFGVWLTSFEPVAAFFLGPARAWELLIGAMLAFGAVPRILWPAAREAVAALGLALIVAACLLIDKETPFPGYAALLPCLGAAALIHSAPGTIVGRALSLRAVVFIGLISYSLYLWHWPLIVFAGYLFLDLGAWPVKIAIAILSFGAAALSWRFVEQPFRQKTLAPYRGQMFGSAMAAGLVLAAVGLSASHEGWPDRFSPEVQRIAAYAGSSHPRRNECKSRDVAKACSFGADVRPSVALWGDSHASAVITAVGDAAARHGKAVKLYWAAGCPPAIGFSRPRFDCPSFQERVAAAIEADEAIGTVILIARYSRYGSIDALGEGLAGTARRMRDAGRRVVIVYPVPESPYDVPRYAAAAAAWRGAADAPPIVRADFLSAEGATFRMLDAIDAERIRPYELLCSSVACATFAGGEPLYRDDNHLALPGNALISPAFDRLFEH